jgi:sec-independent protein translocase protein TatA
MGALSPVHLIVILAIALLVIGPGKLPETGAAVGRAIREFRQAMDSKDDSATVAPRAEPVTDAAELGSGPTSDQERPEQPQGEAAPGV